MGTILTPVLLVVALGFVFAVILTIASKIFFVPVDETVTNLRAELPGANCGACGFSGCDGYAAALSKGETDNTALCAPGGNDAAKAIADVLGVAAGEVAPSAAVVLCKGHKGNASEKYIYQGVDSCKMATQLYGGPKDCTYGCVGLGDCVAACPYDAIHICDGVARVNPLLCRACTMCVKTCPKGLIEMMPLHKTVAAVTCKNHDKGAQTRKDCKVGCIGCMKCVKTCEHDAVKVENFTAHVDYEKCIGCGKCHETCPTGSIDLMRMI